MDNSLIDEILYDYRLDIVKRSPYYKNWNSWNIFHKTISFELSSSKDVESYPYVKTKVFDWLKDFDKKYKTADIMNGWWFCFKTVFNRKNLSRSGKEAKEIESEICKVFDNNNEDDARKEILEEFQIESKKYEWLEKYLKVVYTMGNMTPAPINPGGGGYGSIDFWEYKLDTYKTLYHDYEGDKDILYFQDYGNTGLPEKYSDFIDQLDIIEFMGKRINLILKRAYRIKTGKEITQEDLHELINRL